MSSKCVHGRCGYVCHECGGAGLCEHDRQRNNCQTCSKSKSLCVHRLQFSRCTPCKTSPTATLGRWVQHEYRSHTCLHGIRRKNCTECGRGGTAHVICEHNIRRYRCMKCGNGNYRCTHGRIKILCVPCGGSSTCEHNKIRARCTVCKPIV